MSTSSRVEVQEAASGSASSPRSKDRGNAVADATAPRPADAGAVPVEGQTAELDDERPFKRQRKDGDGDGDDGQPKLSLGPDATNLILRAVPGVPGLFLMRAFVTPAEQSALMANVDSKGSSWDTSLSRRTMHFGHRYDYKDRASAEKAPPVPAWTDDIVLRMQKIGFYTCSKHAFGAKGASTATAPASASPIDADSDADDVSTCQECSTLRPRQLIVNEYVPGQGISAHIDQKRDFGPVVTTLSLLSRVDMVFSCPGKEAVTVALPARSLAVLTGDARYVWRHAIPGRKSDPASPGSAVRIDRSRRVSFTFRTLTSQQQQA